jgi:hypothetical protein
VAWLEEPGDSLREKVHWKWSDAWREALGCEADPRPLRGAHERMPPALPGDDYAPALTPLTMRVCPCSASHLLHSGFLQTRPCGLALAVDSWLSLLS